MSTITVEHLVIALLHNGSTCRGILARLAICPHPVVLLGPYQQLVCSRCAAAGWATVRTLSKPMPTRNCWVIRRQRVPRRKSR